MNIFALLEITLIVVWGTDWERAGKIKENWLKAITIVQVRHCCGLEFGSSKHGEK